MRNKTYLKYNERVQKGTATEHMFNYWKEYRIRTDDNLFKKYNYFKTFKSRFLFLFEQWKVYMVDYIVDFKEGIKSLFFLIAGILLIPLIIIDSLFDYFRIKILRRKFIKYTYKDYVEDNRKKWN